MTRARDARGRFAPRRALPAPDWTVLRIGVDQIAAEPEPLTRQVLPARKAPSAPSGTEWAVGKLHLLLCAAPLLGILIGVCVL